LKAASCIVSFNRHGPAANPARGKVGRARVALRQGGPDALEVEAVAVGNHIELVGDGELQITPIVGEQFGELGLLRIQLDDRLGEQPNTCAARR
jgi:hypothetical protein